MIIMSLIIAYTPVNIAFSAIFHPFSRILGICKTLTSPILLGNLAGFVTGPKLICEISSYNSDKNEFSKAIILSANAGIGFVISFVGTMLWNDIYFGIFLYVTQFLTSVLVSKIIFLGHHTNINQKYKIKNSTFFSSFSKSVSSSTKSIILVCAYTILFSAIITLVFRLTKINQSSILGVIISSFCDVSLGTKASLGLNATEASAFFTGFSVGFGGLCVMFQIFAICDGYPLSKLKFIISKALQGIICGIFSTIYSLVFTLNSSTTTAIVSGNISHNSLFFIALFIFSIINIMKNKFKC